MDCSDDLDDPCHQWGKWVRMSRGVSISVCQHCLRHRWWRGQKKPTAKQVEVYRRRFLKGRRLGHAYAATVLNDENRWIPVQRSHRDGVWRQRGTRCEYFEEKR